MGNWNISIHGTGSHHNFPKDGMPEGLASDANKMAAEFVQALKKAGHTVTAATITYGGEESILAPEDYLKSYTPKTG